MIRSASPRPPFGDVARRFRRCCEHGCDPPLGRHAVLSESGIDQEAEAADELAASIGVRVVDPGEWLTQDCDVLAPCAVGRVIDAHGVDQIRASLVCGAAND